MKSKSGAAACRPLVMLCLALGAASLSAAPASLDENPFGENRSLYDALQGNAHFKALPKPKHTVCGVSYQEETALVYEYVPVGQGVVGTMIAAYTEFDENGQFKGDQPYTESGTFGGMIVLRGTAEPSTAIDVTGDPLFPLAEGKSTRITLTRKTDRHEYACTTHLAPKRFDMSLDGDMYLVSCMRTKLSNNGDIIAEKPSYALCNNTVGFCPLHWRGEGNDKSLFDYIDVNGKRFSPVKWTCQVER
jgi:hypothetical protein